MSPSVRTAASGPVRLHLRTVRIWDPVSWPTGARAGPASRRGAAYDRLWPHGSILATGDRLATFVFWHVRSGNSCAARGALDDHRQCASSSPDGRFFAACGGWDRHLEDARECPPRARGSRRCWSIGGPTVEQETVARVSARMATCSPGRALHGAERFISGTSVAPLSRFLFPRLRL